MINYMKTIFKEVVKLVLANIGITIIGHFLFGILYNFNDKDGFVAFLGVFDILLIICIIFYSMIWCGLSFIPELVGFLLCRKSENKIKTFIGFTTATFVMLGIYVLFWAYFFISMLVAGFNVWFCLIPVGISGFILIQTMIKTYSEYKKVTTTAYVAPNAYPVNYYPGNMYNYGNNNMNYNQACTPNTNGGEYQAGQQYVNPNNNYYE